MKKGIRALRPARPSGQARIGDDELAVFRAAVADVRPLDPSDRVHHEPPAPRPLPLQRWADDRAVLRESISSPISIEDRLDIGDEPHHLREGVSRQVLRDLRRGRWLIEAELDLHGANRDTARAAVVEFLAECHRRDQRCLRIVHGRGLGSPGRMGLLKILVRGWLMQRQEVLAYCQARPQDGGEGALIVLLRSGARR